MKIIFAGTPEFAAQALSALIDEGHEIVLVLTQPDRPAGRGLQLQASVVKQIALQHTIPVLQPRSLRLDGKFPDDAKAAHQLLQNTEHDIMVVAAYGLILPTSVLAIPPLGCINIHASLLPRWRGAAPIVRAIESGDEQTGICIMQMEEGLDTGPVLLRRAIPITEKDTAKTLHDQLAQLGAQCIVDVLSRGIEKWPEQTAVAQNTVDITYAEKIQKHEAQLDFTQSAEKLAYKIRAFNPFPGAHFNHQGVSIKVAFAKALTDFIEADKAPGTIISLENNQLCVQCGQGQLLLESLQKPGGKYMSVSDFLHGYTFELGEILR